MPQLESLALFFNVPIEHLIKWRPESEPALKIDAATLDKIVKLRDHVIAAYISKARKDKQLTSETLAAGCGISADDLLAYENAEKSIPYPVLEALSKFLDIDLTSLHAAHGPLAKKPETAALVDSALKLGDLPPEIVDFINKPINRPYIELAQKLSSMNVDRLRTIAESLLEITY
ncbi:XRE family transcriptional regulator [bacterium]|nr:XRE family transcriptional regulator [bacterium]